MTRKSAAYIGRQCQELSKELERKTKWLTKKINRKLWQTHYTKIQDSYYDTEGLYLVFPSHYPVIVPFKKPFTKLVDTTYTIAIVSEAAMVHIDALKLIKNCKWKDYDCFIIHIPFKEYEKKRRMSDYHGGTN